jgi:hypothetical protein
LSFENISKREVEHTDLHGISSGGGGGDGGGDGGSASSSQPRLKVSKIPLTSSSPPSPQEAVMAILKITFNQRGLKF